MKRIFLYIFITIFIIIAAYLLITRVFVQQYFLHQVYDDLEQSVIIEESGYIENAVLLQLQSDTLPEVKSAQGFEIHYLKLNIQENQKIINTFLIVDNKNSRFDFICAEKEECKVSGQYLKSDGIIEGGIFLAKDEYTFRTKYSPTKEDIGYIDKVLEIVFR